MNSENSLVDEVRTTSVPARQPRSKPRDDPGADVAELYRPVRIRIRVTYSVQSYRERREAYRAGDKRDRDREHTEIDRFYDVVLNSDALDPARGPALIAQAVGRHLLRYLTHEGWPLQVNFVEEDRP